VEATFITTEKKYARRAHFLTLLLLGSFIIFGAAVEVSAVDVKLAWDPSSDDIVIGYNIYLYYSNWHYARYIDVGNRTEYTVTGLDAGITYYIAVTAYSGTGDESSFSNIVTYTTPSDASSSSSNPGVECFIATAAFGSYLAPEVQTLREFRDRVLLTNNSGKAFVEWYYRGSPPVAAFISEYDSLKIAVRWGLTPIVYAVKYPAAAFLLIISIPLAIVVRTRARGR